MFSNKYARFKKKILTNKENCSKLISIQQECCETRDTRKHACKFHAIISFFIRKLISRKNTGSRGFHTHSLLLFSRLFTKSAQKSQNHLALANHLQKSIRKLTSENVCLANSNIALNCDRHHRIIKQRENCIRWTVFQQKKIIRMRRGIPRLM